MIGTRVRKTSEEPAHGWQEGAFMGGTDYVVADAPTPAVMYTSASLGMGK